MKARPTSLWTPSRGGAGSILLDNTVTAHGFDLSGMDIWTAGTLFKNVRSRFFLHRTTQGRSTLRTPSSASTLHGSQWLNLKFGKFELDNLVSESVSSFSRNGGLYQAITSSRRGFRTASVWRQPNRLGIDGSFSEKYSVTALLMLSSTWAISLPSNRSYDTYLTFSRHFK